MVHCGSFVLVPVKRTWGTLDSSIAVHSHTGIQMRTSWTLKLQSIAQTSTKRVQARRGGTKFFPIFFVDVIFAKGMQLKIDTFLCFIFLQYNTSCQEFITFANA